MCLEDAAYKQGKRAAQRIYADPDTCPYPKDSNERAA